MITSPQTPFIINRTSDVGQDLPQQIAAALAETGLIVVRGLVPDLDVFSSLSDRLGRFQVHSTERFSLGKFGQRDNLAADGTISTVNLGQEEIPLHRERAYTPMPPQAMFFYAVQPPASTAPTTALDGCGFLAGLPDDLKQFALTRSLQYTCDFALDDERRALICNGMGAADIEQAQALLPFIAQQALTEDQFVLEEFSSERLAYRIVSPLVRRKTRQGRPSFACNLIHTEEITLDDGTRREDSPQWRAIERLAREQLYEHHWERGDVLVIDNNSAMHGRLAHSDTARQIAVRMGWWGPLVPQA